MIKLWFYLKREFVLALPILLLALPTLEKWPSYPPRFPTANSFPFLSPFPFHHTPTLHHPPSHYFLFPFLSLDKWTWWVFFIICNQHNHDSIFFIFVNHNRIMISLVSRFWHNEIGIPLWYFWHNVWLLSYLWIYQMVLCRVYMDWNKFIFDEVTMPHDWGNLVDES